MTGADWFGTFDIASLAVFSAGIVLYTYLTDHSALHARTISAAMNAQRLVWMREAQMRDMRMLDTGIFQIMMNGMTVFASTSIFVIGGLIAGIAYNAELAAEFSNLPFIGTNTPGALTIKLSLLLVIFVYAFFKFAWAIRLAHYSAILLGALASVKEAGSPEAEARVRRAAKMATLCGHHFNRGLRANFFAVAAVGWLFGPVVFMASTLFIVAVLARREFASKALQAVTEP